MSIDWGASGRRDTYEFRLVDPFTLQETGGTVQDVYGQSKITAASDGDNLVTASFELHGSVPENRLVRVYHTIKIPGCEDFTGCAGTFFVENTKGVATYHSVDRQVAGYSTLYRFTQDTLVRDFARPAGYNIAQEMRELIEADGGKVRFCDGALWNQTRCHTVPIWFEAGTNRAKVLRQICEWTNSELGVDNNGYVTVSPYVSPSDRGLAYTFDDGAWSVYESGVVYTTNGADTINRACAHWSREKVPTHARKDGDSYAKDANGNTIYDPDDSFGLSDSAWVDLPSYDRFSYENIGRRRTHDIKVTEACSHDDLVAQCQRYLDENGGFSEYYEISGPSVPAVGLGSKVHYINSHDHSWPIDCYCEVVQKAVTLGAGCLTDWKLKVIQYNQL